MNIAVNHTKRMELNARMLTFNHFGKLNPHERIRRDSVSQRSRNSDPSDSFVSDSFCVALKKSIKVSFFGLGDVQAFKSANVVKVLIHPCDCRMPGFPPRLKRVIRKDDYVGLESLDKVPVVMRSPVLVSSVIKNDEIPLHLSFDVELEVVMVFTFVS